VCDPNFLDHHAGCRARKSCRLREGWSRQSSLPKSRMENTYDSYSNFFVAFVIRFEQSTFFLR